MAYMNSLLQHTTTPAHPSLLALYRRHPAPGTSTIVDDVTAICKDSYRDLGIGDYSFILETIQDCSASQQQFWESVTTLIQYSVPQMKAYFHSYAEEWQQTLGFAVLEVYWKQDQSIFLDQIESAWERTIVDQGLDTSTSYTPQAEILAAFMIDSLLSTFYRWRALELYETLSERGISMKQRLLESLIRVAVAQHDGQMLERIGLMLLRHEDQYQGSLASPDPKTRIRNRPLLMSAKTMDAFIYGACENELYELARAVFNRGLEAGQKYRISTFTGVLNSYSVKEFGFDIVSAAAATGKGARQSRRSKCGKNQGGEIEAEVFSRPDDDGGATTRSTSATKEIAVANPMEIEKYVRAMGEQGIKPNITTLNVLAKLYLEMTQYKVPHAPSWKSAFRQYNPLRLEPDVVTNNTLLAYYEKHRDLSTMRKIYDDMVGIPERELIKPRRRRRPRKPLHIEQDQLANQQDTSVDSTGDRAVNEDTPSFEEYQEQPQTQDLQEHEPPLPKRHLRSNRDIYTYNIMLHALLQHAVETNDIASIGQCFYDMEQDGISADTVTFNTNILYHISRGDLTSAMQVFRSMKGTRANGRTSIQSSSKPVRSTPSSTFVLSRSAASSQGSVSGSVGADSQQQGQTPFSKMSSDEVAVPASATTSPPAPDVVTLTSMISGFAHAGQMDKATHFFKEMINRYRIEPSLKTYSTLVAGLQRAGDYERAERLWDIVLEEDEEQRQDKDGPAREKEGKDRRLDVEASDLLDGKSAERIQQCRQDRTDKHLTIMERRQIETWRKLYKESLAG
ncbi:hypothetical protein BGZ54_001018 [Gamsiella multidivaricata]|nr:hypothetical protein BGZ54_001018 [Gamsiella multidivaricata]